MVEAKSELKEGVRHYMAAGMEATGKQIEPLAPLPSMDYFVEEEWKDGPTFVFDFENEDGDKGAETGGDKGVPDNPQLMAIAEAVKTLDFRIGRVHVVVNVMSWLLVANMLMTLSCFS